MAERIDTDRRIRFSCPGCGVLLKARPEQAGRQFRCPKCRAAVTVPEAAERSQAVSREVSLAETGPGEPDSTPSSWSGNRAGRGGAPSAEDQVAELWQPGDVILDLYEVKDTLGEGGFGKVHRVHHRGWNVDLAVKSPLPGRFRTERDKQKFVEECETWVNLGLH